MFQMILVGLVGLGIVAGGIGEAGWGVLGQRLGIYDPNLPWGAVWVRVSRADFAAVRVWPSNVWFGFYVALSVRASRTAAIPIRLADVRLMIRRRIGVRACAPIKVPAETQSNAATPSTSR